MLPLAQADPADTARPVEPRRPASRRCRRSTRSGCAAAGASSEPLTWTPSIAARSPSSRRSRSADQARASVGHLGGRDAPRRRRARRSRARSACPAAGRARGRRRRTAARGAPSAGACARRARRRLAARGSCAPRSTAGRCPSRSTSSGMRPNACAASVWNRTPRARVMRPIAASGCSTPISLLAAITLTRIVFGSSAASSAARSIRPSAPTGSMVTRQPRASRWRQVSSTARCSVATVTMWSPRSRGAGGDALDGEVVGLGGAAGEDDVLVRGADRRRRPGGAPLRRRRGCGGRRRDRGSRRCRPGRAATAASRPARADRPASWRGRPGRSSRIIAALDRAPSGRATRSAAWIAATVKISG